MNKKNRTFLKIIRKDRINLDGFKEILPKAQKKLNKYSDEDVLHLTISMNSPLSLIDAEKVTPKVFEKLVKLEN